MCNSGNDSDRIRKERSTVLCPECRLFLETFVEAVHEIIFLQEQHILAVVEGDGDAHRFDILIHAANEKKLNAKYAYVAHQEKHGSSSSDETNRR